MLLFFAAVASTTAKKVTRAAGARNYLLSFVHGDAAFDLNCDALCDPDCNLLVDSGAFSAWRIGTRVDLRKYMDFMAATRESSVCGLRFVNLDVIPGGFNKRPTPQQRQESAVEGWRNYATLKDAGFETIHVFHMHEDFRWLDRIANCSDYIGISPANDVSVAERDHWLDQVFTFLDVGRTRVRTHGFAVTAAELLTQYPFYSADSTTWMNGAKYGSFVMFPERRPEVVQLQRTQSVQNLRHIHKWLIPFEDSTLKRYLLGALTFVELEAHVTELWADRGIDWTGRMYDRWGRTSRIQDGLAGSVERLARADPGDAASALKLARAGVHLADELIEDLIEDRSTKVNYKP